LGFSLGGFLAAEFAGRFPERVDELILVGIRKNYESGSLAEIKAQLCKNKRSWLYKFYVSCFSRQDPEGLSWFRKNLLKDYTDNFNLQELLWGLDYLETHKLQPEKLATINKVRIFHGSHDSVAPVEEAQAVKATLPNAKFIYLNGLGHIAFLNPAFKEEFVHG
jgi:malonyl-CoA O-methyltransferase